MIVINGYYGAGNFGDDIILLSIIYSIREFKPLEDIYVIIISEARMPKMPQNINLIKRTDINGLINKIKECDLLITGGGGIFQDYSGFDIERHIIKRDRGIDFYTVPMEIAYLMKKPIMVYAVGAGPINNSEYSRFFKTILEWPDIITVRDNTSLEIIKNINKDVDVKFTSDPAVNFIDGYKKYNNYFIEKDKKNVGICLRDWFLMNDDESEKFSKEIAKTADYIIEKYGLDIILFPYCTSKKDSKLLKNVYKNAKYKNNIILKEEINIDEALNILSQLKFLIGMRLHSLIVASSINIPCIGINYDDKIKEYMRLLEMNDFVLDLNILDSKKLNYRVDEIMKNYNNMSEVIKRNIKILKQMEISNTLLAIKLLSGEYNG